MPAIKVDYAVRETVTNIKRNVFMSVAAIAVVAVSLFLVGGVLLMRHALNRAGTTVLMVTHDREMVDKMRKRVIALDEGRLARDERRGGYE